jgi:hypothetical protein
MSLLICGDDTPVIDYYLRDELNYSILTPYLQDKNLKDYFKYSLKYATPAYRKLFDWVKEHSSVIVTSDLDYEIPMQKIGIETHFIPNPINKDTITFTGLAISKKEFRILKKRWKSLKKNMVIK